MHQGPGGQGSAARCRQAEACSRPLSPSQPPHRVQDGALVRVLERGGHQGVCVCTVYLYYPHMRKHITRLSATGRTGRTVEADRPRRSAVGGLETWSFRTARRAGGRLSVPTLGADIQEEPMLPSESQTQENTASQLEGRQAGGRSARSRGSSVLFGPSVDWTGPTTSRGRSVCSTEFSVNLIQKHPHRHVRGNADPNAWAPHGRES